MSQNVTGFRWSGKSERAAELVADDRLTDEQIAAQVKIDRRSLARWKQQPAFAERVAQIVEATRRAVLEQGIADRVNRVRQLDDRWRRMQRVIVERADDPSFAHVPGWQTGLLVRTVKAVGKGEDFTLIDLFEVDTGLLAEMRQTEKQAAQELGQWIEKGELDVREQRLIITMIQEAPPPAPSINGDVEIKVIEAPNGHAR